MKIDKRRQRFHVGDTVRFRFGVSHLRAKIIEDRGPLAPGGEQVYTISFLRGRHMTDIPVSHLTLVKTRLATSKKRVTHRKRSA